MIAEIGVEKKRMRGKKRHTKWCKVIAKKLKGSKDIAVFLNPDGLTPGSPTSNSFV